MGPYRGSPRRRGGRTHAVKSMAQIRQFPGRRGWYSDFRHNGHRIFQKLADDKREAQIRLGQLMDRLRTEERGEGVEDYPWAEMKTRIIDRNERRKKLNGLKRDEVALTLFERFFLKEARRAIASPADVTTDNLELFAATRAREGRHPATIKRELGSLKSIMRWAQSRKPPLRPVVDWRTVPIPKVGKRQPPHYTREQLRDLIRSIPGGRWRMVVFLGSRAGLRRGEMRHLRPEDVRLDRGVIAVVGKPCARCVECLEAGGRWEPKDVDEREVPIPGDLRAYLKEALPALRRRSWVLDDGRNHSPSLAEMSTYAARLTQGAGMKGGLQKLRATWICHMLDDGIPAPVVQRWAGHSSLATTEGYTSPGKHDAAHISKARPLDL